jgi:O-antigen/teichoic acid export membrane protein
MSVRRSLAWMIISQGGLFILQFGSTVVLSRLLTPYETGVYAASASIIGLLSILQSFGLSLLIIREPEIDEDLIACAFTINALLATFLAATIFGLSSVGGYFLNEIGVQHVMSMLAILPLLQIFEFLPASNLERRGQFKVIAAVNFCKALVNATATISFAVTGFSYMSIAWGAILAAVAGAIGFNIAGKQHVSLRPGLAEWRRVLRFGMEQIAIQGVNTASNRISEFLLGRLLGLSALGLFSRAATLNSLIWNHIHLVVGRVVFVELAEQKRKGISLRQIYLHTVEIITGILWPAFTGMAIMSGPAVRIVFGEQWIGAAMPLTALSLASLLLVSITMTWELFVVNHETGTQARLEAVRSGVGLAFFTAGTLISLTAAAAGRIAEACFSLWLYRPHISRMTSTKTGDFVSIYCRSAILTLAGCCPAFILMVASEWSAQVSVASVAAAIVAGLILWSIAASLTKHAVYYEGKRIIVAYRARSTHSKSLTE